VSSGQGKGNDAHGRWVFRAGELARDGWETVVDQSIEGWRWTGFRVANLAPGEKRSLPAADTERCIVPLAGSFTVTYIETGRARVTRELEGRPSVFHGPSDVLYLGAGTSVEISGTGRVAVAEAWTSEVLPAVYVPREKVAIELRGAGRNSRQVHNFGTPANLAAARLQVVEVITPSLNWSSFPPHKHDTEVPGKECILEELYYFETAVTRDAGSRAAAAADPMAYMRAYSSDQHELDYVETVRTGDVCLCPYAYHGPAIAAPGADMYFLNVMAGPGKREWIVCEDVSQGWVKEMFAGESIDPRLPYTRD
jgi:5-deoxy-glucuronate isomerase